MQNIVTKKAPTEDIVTWKYELKVPSDDIHDNFGTDILKCNNWPIKTQSLCHYCCHSFSTIPVPLPQVYDKVKRIYYCRGIFCSWQCAKAYNNTNSALIGRGDRNMFISILAFKMWVKYRMKNDKVTSKDCSVFDRYSRYHIIPSQPKETLKAFGGKTDIDDYRKGFFGIIPPNEAIVGKPFLNIRESMVLPFIDLSLLNCAIPSKITTNSTNDDKLSANTHRTPFMKPTGSPKGSTLHKSANEFCNRLNRAKDSNTMLKRKREKDTKNTLMSSMGVVVEKRKK